MLAEGYLRKAVEVDDKNSVALCLVSLVSYLSLSNHYLSLTLNPRSHLTQLGETLINLGNTADEESEQEEQEETFFKEAFECFHKVKQLDADALPPQFVEFVESWEADLQEEDEGDR